MKLNKWLLLLLAFTIASACKKSTDEPEPAPPTPPTEQVNTLDEKAVIAYSPAFPTDDKEITLIFNADKGNAGLKSYGGEVFIWTGVITDKSTGPTDWKYVKSPDFNKPDQNAKLTRLSTDKYQIKFTPRTFYGVPAGEKILKLAMLFKNSDGSVSGRNVDGSDIYLPINPSGNLGIRFMDPEFNAFYTPEVANPIRTIGESVKLTAVASATGKITISLNGTEVKSAENVASLTTDVALTKSGQNEIKAIISSGGKTAEQKFTITVKGEVEVAALPSGANPDGVTFINGGTSAIFTLFAPGKQNIFLTGDFTDWKLDVKGFMKKTPDGKRWWVQIDGLTAGEKYGYQFMVNGSLRVADPYSELVLDPANDQYIPATVFPSLKPYPIGKTTGIVSVAQGNTPAYVWKNTTFTRPEKSKLVIYELHLRDFLGTHSYSTLSDTLNYFSGLGVNAIELMPVNEFEGNSSWGYNPSFYFTPDKYYGTKNMLKEVIDECHKRGIAVILDMVLNHSFGQSPMVQLYFDSKTGKTTADNPWFNQVETHPYNVGYDFNHESADTKYFTKNVMKFWMEEYKVDGFRFDLSKGFTQKNSGSDVTAWSAYDASRIAIWKDYNNYMKSIDPNFYVILEHLGVDQEEKELANEGMILWNNMNYQYNQNSMGYYNDNADLTRANYTSHGFSQPNLVTYMESHDEQRHMFKNKSYGASNGTYDIKEIATGLKRQEAVAAFLFTVPGPNMLWQFGELGYDISIDEGGRTGEKPILWNYYSDPNRKALRNVFAKMIKLKTKTNALQNATYTSVVNATPVKYMVIQSASAKIVVVANFGVVEQPAEITFPSSGAWYEYVGSGSGTINLPTTSYNTVLKPGEYHVYTSTIINP